MKAAVPDCIVTGYEELVEGLTLPDVNDRYVLAAAIHAGAQVVVTFNLKDFPARSLDPYSIEAKHPDDFILETIDLAPGLMIQVLSEQARALRNPPRTISELLDTLREQGLASSVARLRELMA